MLKSFSKGGVHPPDRKFSADVAIESMPLPEVAVVPMSQHIGAPARAVVEKGDSVKVGELIGEAVGYVSCNIHSPISGVVTAVEMRPNVGGVLQQVVVIEREGEGDEWLEEESCEKATKFDVGSVSSDDILRQAQECGVVGLGGATFPTHVKLRPPANKKIDSLIVNGSECEPYLTADYRVMLEQSERLIVGAQLMAKAVGAERIYIGIENNKKPAIKLLREVVKDEPTIEVVALKTMYPQGGEKQLIDAILGRQVPSEELPLDVGVVVQNISTTLALYAAVVDSRPLIERVVTVSGVGVENPSNLMVRIGTPISELIELCGGLPEGTTKVVLGGPMMGRATADLSLPVTKGVSGVVIMEGQEALRKPHSNCIKCGRCINACPMGLQPYLLYKLGEKRRFEEMEREYAFDCIECGSCSYGCPASLPLLDYIKLGKAEVIKLKRARKE